MNGISENRGVLDAIRSSQAGINRGLAGLARDAHIIAHANVEPENTNAVTGALVDSLEQRFQVQLSARMLATANQTLGTLLDVIV